eukprot:884166-Amphidinium_carterae.1
MSTRRRGVGHSDGMCSASICLERHSSTEIGGSQVFVMVTRGGNCPEYRWHTQLLALVLTLVR